MVYYTENNKERTILQGMTSQYDIGLFVHSRPHTRLPEPLRFPPGFLWGTATSAHQVEGQNTNNQWWVWEQQGRCWHGDVSGDACGWWRDAEGDLDRAAALGTNAHRMSIEWSRIEPEEGILIGVRFVATARSLAASSGAE